MAKKESPAEAQPRFRTTSARSAHARHSVFPMAFLFSHQLLLITNSSTRCWDTEFLCLILHSCATCKLSPGQRAKWTAELRHQSKGKQTGRNGSILGYRPRGMAVSSTAGKLVRSPPSLRRMWSDSGHLQGHHLRRQKSSILKESQSRFINPLGGLCMGVK